MRRAAGIRHLVYASAGIGERGTGVGSWESKLDIEWRLREVGVPHTVLRPMAFWEEVAGRPPQRFPMPLWLFERFVGKDLSTMWRWLREANLPGDTGPTREILPTAMTVRQWLTRQHSAG